MSSFLVIKAAGALFSRTSSRCRAVSGRRIAVAEPRQYSEPQKHKSR